MIAYFKKFGALFITYYLLGRKAAVPLGLKLFDSWPFLFGSLFIIEGLQIPLFYFLMGPVAQKISLITKLKKMFAHQKKKIFSLRLFRILQSFGMWGVFVVISMPTGTGGVLGGVLLAKLLGIDNRKRTIVTMLCGIAFGEILLIFGLKTIISLIPFLDFR